MVFQELRNLFEARKPANAAQISDLAGTIEFGPEVRGTEELLLDQRMEVSHQLYTVPKGRYVIVNEGDYVRAGDANYGWTF